MLARRGINGLLEAYRDVKVAGKARALVRLPSKRGADKASRSTRYRGCRRSLCWHELKHAVCGRLEEARSARVTLASNEV